MRIAKWILYENVKEFHEEAVTGLLKETTRGVAKGMNSKGITKWISKPISTWIARGIPVGIPNKISRSQKKSK